MVATFSSPDDGERLTRPTLLVAQADRDRLERPREPPVVLGIGLVALHLLPPADREALVHRDAASFAIGRC
jgi:hypothetical protein